MADATPMAAAELAAGLKQIQDAPKDDGILEMIVRRPQVDERAVTAEGDLDPGCGLLGDSWKVRYNSRSPDGLPDPDKQITVMNSRAIALIARTKERWPLAGDQLFVDMDLGITNLPAGTRIAIGSAIIEVTPAPHTGCQKFLARFGLDAHKFVNSPLGRQLNLRGINARVIRAGTIRVGDLAKKLGGKLPQV
jgi:hypothetical protein